MEKIPESNPGLDDEKGTEEKKKSKRICAWCKTVMGEKEGDGMATHGVCEKCAAEMDAELTELESEKK